MKRIILPQAAAREVIYIPPWPWPRLSKEMGDEVELLPVGAEGKMEMDKIWHWPCTAPAYTSNT